MKLRHWLSLFGLLVLGGCAVATPFRGAGYTSQQGVTLPGDATVLVGLTRAVLKDDRATHEVFWEHVNKVEASLNQQPGFIGYSKRMELFGNNAWTMTVWNTEAEMNAFVRGAVHQAAIREGYASLESARFARLTVKREEIPLSWDNALILLESKGRGY